MAGSYDHAVADDGQLLENEEFTRMVENLGDAYETVEEMYGMIWYLAVELAHVLKGETVEPWELIEQARVNYESGLALSPGTKGRI